MDKNKYLRIRIDDELYCKLDYISKYEIRSNNGQVRQWIKEHIRDFEKIHGKIDIENIEYSIYKLLKLNFGARVWSYYNYFS